MSTAAVPVAVAGMPPDRSHRSARSRVYVSSSASDLREARAVVIEVIRRNGCEPVAMESYGADGRRPVERCLLDVRSCEIYVGIVAWRYGSCPPGEARSFTDLEYREAVAHGKQVLLFHLEEKAQWPTAYVDRSQHAVRALRAEQLRNHVVDHFTTNEELATGVRRALHRLLGSSAFTVPDLLPYIVDRNVQKETLAARSDELDRSPSLIIVHGAADQVHHKFVELMHERLLARYLGVGQVHPVSVALRSEELDRPDVITRRTADSCGLDPTLDVDVLSGWLHEIGSLTLLRFPVRVDVHRGRPVTRGVDRLVEYFAGWPQRRPLRVLPVISAQYATPPSRSRLTRWMASPHRHSIAHAIEKSVELAGGCAVVVLPELINIEQVEVEVWAEQEDVRCFLGDQDPMPAIRRMFEEHERSSKLSGMPMELLAAELTRLLHRMSPS